ncbi:MAG: glutamyl-tRNA reductase [Phycisphaerae bacterium]|nr:glutamyl-tRNA reductase [Phycisphaerae bacterium]
MQIILVGINHKTASVDIRQQLAFDTQLAGKALRKLKDTYPDCEFVLLSTCNRVECYAVVEKTTDLSPTALAEWLADFRSVDFEVIKKSFYIKTDEDVAAHLFTVSSSLDSMVIGENQITFQVKESYKLACHCKTTGKILNHLFHETFRTTKKIVSQTSIFNRRVSVAGVAVDLAKQLLSDIKSAGVVIAGAGQMAELLVEYFQHENCRTVTVVNRSEKRGCRLAEKRDISRQPWELLDREIVGSDIVVGAAADTQGYLFGKDRIKSLMARRQNRPLLIIDIAVPRCFDLAVEQIENVHLYSIDDLAQVAQDNIKLREGDLGQAIEIICESVSAFTDWFLMRDVGPLIGQIKDAFEQIYEIQKKNFLTKTQRKIDDEERMNISKGRVINKICHRVVNNINVLSKEHGPEEAEKFARSLLADARQIISGKRMKKR